MFAVLPWLEAGQLNRATTQLHAEAEAVAREALPGTDHMLATVADLPPGVDPCGENGEFHTFCHAGPMFAAPIAVAVGETLTRDGFCFTDVLPR